MSTPTWDERKRLRNIKDHGLNFSGADAIWDHFTVTREDIRDGDMHVISLRKAEPHETRYYLEAAEDFFGKKG